MKKGTIYFAHDVTAAIDPKIIKLRVNFGLEGYGAFWVIVETLRSQEGYLPLDNSGYETLAFLLQKDVDFTKHLVDSLIEYGLLRLTSDMKLYSERVLASVEHLNMEREKRVKAAEKRWANSEMGKNDAGALINDSDSPEKMVESMQTKINKTKLKENTLPASNSDKQNLSEDFKNNPESLKSQINQENYEISIKLSKHLFDWCIKNNPNFKKPNIDSWGIEIDRMIRLESRKPEDIQKIIDFCQQDSFWLSNILSTKALRKHYDKLYSKQIQSAKESSAFYRHNPGNQQQTKPVDNWTQYDPSKSKYGHLIANQRTGKEG